MRRECYLVKLVAAEREGNVPATSQFNSGAFDVSGVEAHFTQIRTIPVDQGRFFTDDEEKAGRRFCIIGTDVKKQLFGTRPDVNGSQLAINGIPYRIIGVMASKEQNDSYSGLDEKKIFLPY